MADISSISPLLEPSLERTVYTGSEGWYVYYSGTD